MQKKETPLMFAAKTQSSAVVELLLNGKADVDARDNVSACEGDGAGCHMCGVAGAWIITGCSLWGLDRGYRLTWISTSNYG